MMEFERWLAKAGYQPSTVRGTVRTVEGVRMRFEDAAYPKPLPLDKGARAACARYMTFFDETLGEPCAGGFYEFLQDAGVQPVQVKIRERQSRVRKRGFSDEEWALLATALDRRHDPEAVVLYLMACSGLRVGDVLPITKYAIEEGLKTGDVVLRKKGGDVVSVPVGGTAEAWQRLHDAMQYNASNGGDLNVAGWVLDELTASPLAGDAAYQRVNRYLKKLGRELDLSEPIHLHRMRRTVAVQALRVTKDSVGVQQLLGHQSHASTLVYLDEKRSDDVARLQRKLGQFRKGSEE